MNRFITLLIALAGSVLPLVAQDPIAYRFDRVQSKVTVTSSARETRASVGLVAHGGDRVRTGWLGYALLAAPRYETRFEIFGGSDVRLTSETPGVLLSLERGRVKAIFDKLTGDEPRMVRTPGALLAVRGTRYGIEVDRRGVASLAVFEGIVEVRSPLRPEPLLVRAGETCHFSASMRPEARPMPRGMTEEMWQRHGTGMGGGNMPGETGMGGRSGSHGPANRPTSGSGHHGSASMLRNEAGASLRDVATRQMDAENARNRPISLAHRL